MEEKVAREDELKPLTSTEVHAIVSTALAEERAGWDVRFVEQEHRTIRVVQNWYDAIKGDRRDLKRSAWLALLWHFLVPRPGTVAIVAGGLATLIVTMLGVAMAYRANLLLERQNTRIDVQNLLTEAQRRSNSLNAELAIIIPLIERERESAPVKENVILSAGLQSRITNLSISLQPYKTVSIVNRKEASANDNQPYHHRKIREIFDFIGFSEERSIYEISDELYSPERAQLLSILIINKVNVSKISGIILKNSLIRGFNINNVDLSNINLENSRIDGSFFSYVNLVGTNLSNSLITNSSFSRTNFDDLLIFNTKFDYVTMSYIVPSEIDYWRPTSQSCSLTNVAVYPTETAQKFVDTINSLGKKCKLYNVFFNNIDREKRNDYIKLVPDRYQVCFDSVIGNLSGVISIIENDTDCLKPALGLFNRERLPSGLY